MATMENGSHKRLHESCPRFVASGATSMFKTLVPKILSFYTCFVVEKDKTLCQAGWPNDVVKSWERRVQI